MLIGLIGGVGTGKDEAAKVLVRAGWHAIAFADALRIEVAEAWAIDIRVFVDRTAKESNTPQLQINLCCNRAFTQWAEHVGLDMRCPRSPRWVMQAWGTWRRIVNPLHWVAHVENWVNYHHSIGHKGLVVTDVRLANEAEMVRWRGGHLVRVHRPGLPALPAETAAHESERHNTLPADMDLHNDGDLQHLQAEVWRVVQQLGCMPSDATHLPNATLPTTNLGEAEHG